jgi:hypothetical protein
MQWSIKDWPYKLFSAILYAYSGMYLMYSIMVSIMLSLGKWWSTGQSLVLHCFAYIIGITEGIDISSFQHVLDIQGHQQMVGIFFLAVPSFAMPELIDYTIISHKSEYNTWHRGYIEIQTSYFDFTSKMGPGNVPYVISRCHLIPSNFGNFYKTCCNKGSK